MSVAPPNLAVEQTAGLHALVPRSGFQWQVKRNVFSRKEGKRSGSNKDLSRKTPDMCDFALQNCWL